MAACLRMVLESLGVVKTEEELRVLTDSNFDSEYFPGGAEAHRVVDTAKQLGFSNTSKNNLSLQELVGVLIEGRFPIVQLAVRLVPNTPLQTHAAVVVEINQNGVLLFDPVRGEIVHSQDEFNEMWQLRRGLAILIE
jgi:ABC-type bacteriocin/lantibiotic exporter with double-glycine peptidase domain